VYIIHGVYIETLDYRDRIYSSISPDRSRFILRSKYQKEELPPDKYGSLTCYEVIKENNKKIKDLTLLIKQIEHEIKSHPSYSGYEKPKVEKYFDIGGIYFKRSNFHKGEFYDTGFERSGYYDRSYRELQ